MKNLYLSVCGFALLVSCGGGGGGGAGVILTPPPPPPNQKPIADAGPNLSFNINQTGYQVDGSNSRDPDGNIVSYSWQIVEEPATTTVNTLSEPKLEFSASAPGDYIVELRVKDNDGASDTDRATVTLMNQPPNVVLEPFDDASIVGKSVLLDASNSTDPNGHSLSYKWRFVDAPTGSKHVDAVYTVAKHAPTFDASGKYTVELTVSDGYASEVITLSPIQVEPYDVVEFEGVFSAAEFNTEHDLVLGVNGKVLTFLELDGSSSSVMLPYEANDIGIDGFGKGGVVSHDGAVTFIDVGERKIDATYTVPANLRSIILGSHDHAHAVEDGSGVVDVYSISKRNGAVIAGSEKVAAGTKLAKKSDSNTSYFYGVEPDDASDNVIRLETSNDRVSRIQPSGYAGVHEFCGGIWMSLNGDRILSACGVALNSFSTATSDSAFAYSLSTPNHIKMAAGSIYNSEWAVVDGTSLIRFFDLETGSAQTTLKVPEVDGRPGVSRFIFALDDHVSPDGEEGPIIFGIAEPNVSDPERSALFIRYAASVNSTQGAPTAVSDRYRTERVGKSVSLDGSNSFDPNGDPLAYDWKLISEPSGSSIIPVGMDTATPSFTPSVRGTYEFRLRVDDGVQTSPDVLVSVNVFDTSEQRVHRLQGNIADMEYSSELKALFYLPEGESTLKRLSLDTLETHTLALERESFSLDIGPSGTMAAVSHEGAVSLISLSGDMSVKDIEIHNEGWGSVVLDAEERAYLFPDAPGDRPVQTLDFAANTVSSEISVYGGLKADLHSNGEWIYGIITKLSPPDIVKFRIIDGALLHIGESPYHGHYDMNRVQWISNDGTHLLNSGGSAFLTTSDRSTDMHYTATVSNDAGIDWADHNPTLGQWAAKAHGYDGIVFFDDEMFVISDEAPISSVPSSEGDLNGRAVRVYYTGDTDEHIVVLDASNGTRVSDPIAIQLPN